MVNPKKNTNQEQIILWPADCFIVIALICSFFILLGEPLKNDGIVSLGTRGLIFSLVGFAGLQLITTLKGNKSKDIYYFIAVIAATMFSALLSGVTAIIDQLIPFLCFFMLPISLLLSKKIHNVGFIKKTIYRFNLIYTLLWTILFFSSLSHVFYGEHGRETIDALTLGYANPNQTGVFLMISFIIALASAKRRMKKRYQITYFIQALWTFALIYQTQSRTCIIISTAVLLFVLFKLADKVGKKFTFFCFLLPAFMTALLLLGGRQVQEFLIFNEEFDTGRVDLFRIVISRLTPTTFLFGNFAGWIGNNLHNSYFTIFAIFGIVGFTVYIVFLGKIVQDYFAQLDRQSLSSIVAYLGVLAVIAHGSTESTLLTAGVVYGSLVTLIFVLTLNEDKKE